MKIVVVNGAPESGKTTFENLCNYLIEAYPHKYGINTCFVFSTINFVKEVAKFCGWNGEKTPENRRFLSDLKDLLTEWGDVPIRKIEKGIRNFNISEYSDSTLIFIDSREPKEIKRLQNKWGATSILVRRPNHQILASNHADAEVENYKYDYIIENDGSLEDLTGKANDFLEWI